MCFLKKSKNDFKYNHMVVKKANIMSHIGRFCINKAKILELEILSEVYGDILLM